MKMKTTILAAGLVVIIGGIVAGVKRPGPEDYPPIMILLLAQEIKPTF